MMEGNPLLKKFRPLSYVFIEHQMNKLQIFKVMTIGLSKTNLRL